MTFEEFQDTGRYCNDLGAVLKDATWENDPVPASGMLYLDVLYIDEVKEHWPEEARAEGAWHLLIEREEWITDNLISLEQKLYQFAIQAGYCDAPPQDNPRVHYHGDNENPTVLPLNELIANFDANDGWKYRHNEEDMRGELASRGWYEGLHENGHYLVLNLDLLKLEPQGNK